ncbi:MAG: hypothetical protein EB127_11780 [Alphaproteobacteria bacterium]|nr:hypothetical protein [Alphaproteobacteria bacterium]
MSLCYIDPSGHFVKSSNGTTNITSHVGHLSIDISDTSNNNITLVPTTLTATDGTNTTTINPTSVTSATFTGDLSGNVAVQDNNTNASFYPVFVSNNTGKLPLCVDKTTNPLSYNPSTATLTTTNITLATPANSSNTTTACTTEFFYNNVPQYTPMYAKTGLSGGIIAYTIDPYSCLSNVSIGIGFANFNCIYLTAGSVIANIVYNLVGVGASNLYRFGLYSGTGTLLATTASVGDTTTGVKKVAFTSSYTIPTSGFYYTCVMLLSGTSPSFNSCGTVNIRDYSNYPNNTNQVNNGNLAYFRCCQNLTAISSPTALPSSFSSLTLTPYYITFSFGLTSS